ncbi:hypothetical protein ACHAXA_002000 [Cyclostephanos tholiformis]|uniref:Sulfotransferase n=1 Tax=Cyclostephanos tholiformis TaxID=382380 RepID=A0ABD3RZL3_9STRA
MAVSRSSYSMMAMIVILILLFLSVHVGLVLRHLSILSHPPDHSSLGSEGRDAHEYRDKSTTRTTNDDARDANFTAIGGHYDCSVYWLRMPKTASTSVTHAFVRPLMSVPGLLTNLMNAPNTCILGPGGCRHSWGEGRNRSSTSTTTRSIDHPPTPTPDRCLPRTMGRGMGPPTSCYEYDSRTSVLDYGPDGPYRGSKGRKGRGIGGDAHGKGASRGADRRRPRRHVVVHHAYGPALNTHVGLDTSLLGWILPHRPMVYATFREPVERLLSSFHYGIKYGGGLPGTVEKCTLPSTSSSMSSNGTALMAWQADVVRARRIASIYNDTSVYQGMLRDYLTSCSNAADNAYVQFLDPKTKDVRVALRNLERHVIVGLQSDVRSAVERFGNVVLRSCIGHPRYHALERALETSSSMATDGEDGYLRRSATRVFVSSNPTDLEAVDGAVELAPPDTETFDADLRVLVRKMTEGDEVIYKRALELYYQQSIYKRGDIRGFFGTRGHGQDAGSTVDEIIED